MSENEAASQGSDEQLDRVFGAVATLPYFAEHSELVVRKAIDRVLRGDSTGRYSIGELTPEEKKHIGTHVEQGLIREFFDDRRGERLDTTVEGVEVDIKNTVGETWMIPPEAVNKICLLSAIDETSQKYSIGLIRANESILTKPNQDKKRSLSSRGRSMIRWIVRDRDLRVSVFARDTNVRLRVFSKKSGQARVAELFRQVEATPIQRSDIEVAAVHKGRQVDVRARVRDAKIKLRSEGLLLLRGWNSKERDEARRRGRVITKSECIVLKLSEKSAEQES